MNTQKWIQTFTLFTLMNVGILITFNYLIDPFNIFHTNFLKHQFQMNERFIKVEFLEKHHNDFNGYLFGSSRIGTTHPSSVEKYIPQSKLYNFTLSSANLYDYLIHLRYFIKNHYPMKILYLQIDIDNMMYYGQNSSDYLSKTHPYILNQSLPLYYLEYLSGFFPFNTQGKIANNLNYKEGVSYHLNNGTWSVNSKEIELSTNCQNYVESVDEFHTKHNPALKYIKVKENITALKEIVDLCKKNHIKLYLFTTPHNQNMMDTFYKNDYLNYLKSIANITDFYDFSGYNSITTNNCNYYEISHYRPSIGKLIAARIFNDKKILIPNDFGIWVTKENIEDHLKILENQIKKHREKIL